MDHILFSFGSVCISFSSFPFLHVLEYLEFLLSKIRQLPLETLNQVTPRKVT
jgi:hypothetical protein